MGYQQIVGLAAATALTVPAGARIAYIEAEAQAVRWRDDGTNPTATIGQPLPVGRMLTYVGDLTRIKFFQQAATANLNITYFTDA
jgi:hypothetical protein